MEQIMLINYGIYSVTLQYYHIHVHIHTDSTGFPLMQSSSRFGNCSTNSSDESSLSETSNAIRQRRFSDCGTFRILFHDTFKVFNVVSLDINDQSKSLIIWSLILQRIKD